MADACRAVGIARSVYYHKPQTSEQQALKRAEDDANIRDLIETIQVEMPQYGARRLKMHLREHYGLDISRPRIGRIMPENGLKALIWRGFKVKTTDDSRIACGWSVTSCTVCSRSTYLRSIVSENSRHPQARVVGGSFSRTCFGNPRKHRTADEANAEVEATTLKARRKRDDQRNTEDRLSAMVLSEAAVQVDTPQMTHLRS